LTGLAGLVSRWISRRVSRKGFVGPLGDDIPSIFPIVFGVMLFFGTIAFAGNLVAEKNSYLEVRKAAVSLSYILTEKGFVTGTSFGPKCAAIEKAATANNVFVLVTVKRFCGPVVFTNDAEDPVSPYYYASVDDRVLGHTWRSCTNNPDVKGFPASGQAFIPSKKSFAVVFNYPVAVPCPGESSPNFGHGLMNIIVWKK
jgi:hypothetical protein